LQWEDAGGTSLLAVSHRSVKIHTIWGGMMQLKTTCNSAEDGRLIEFIHSQLGSFIPNY